MYAFNNIDIRNKLINYPYIMSNPNELYRLVTHGFIHGDQRHLLFNMISLFFMGRYVEKYYYQIQKPYFFLILYLTAIIAASIPSLIKNKHNNYYSSLGASGGISAIAFSFAYIDPWSWVLIGFIIPMPAILFTVIYVIYSYKMDKKGIDNIGHDAHLWGGLYGLLFTFIFDPFHGKVFFYNLLHPSLPF